MSIHELSIGTRSGVLAGSGIVAALIIGVLSIYQIGNINRSEKMLAEDALPSLEIINTLNDDLNNLRVTELQFATTSMDAQKQLTTKAADYRARIAKHLEHYTKNVDNDEERGAFEKLKEQIATYQTDFDKTVTQTTPPPASRDDGALYLQLDASDKAFDETGNRIDTLLKYNNGEVRKSHDRAQSSYTTALRLIIGALLLAGLVSITLTVWIIRGLKRELGGEPRDVGGIARRIAAGDLTVTVPMAIGDTSSVMFAMKEMRDSLLAIVRTVRNGVSTISTASTEIAAGNQDLSSRTEQQASSLQETASSMEQLTATVKQNADNAQRASQLAATASDIAQAGGAVVAQVVEKMGTINASSQKIADIIGVIDGIAFQTNILALNAAVEAARAGEQGRGFAVVATEVRSLAQRSAQAAKEVKILINDSVEQVGAGNKLVAQAGNTMANVVDSISRVAAIMGEITTASDEQSTGIGQVNLAIAQMDQVTQQNAALVEQAAAAAESMQEQAGGLAQAVDVFKTGDTAAAAAAAARPLASRTTPPRSGLRAVALVAK